MNLSEEGKDIVTMNPIGTDPWSRTIYKDTEGNLWKDVTLENGDSIPYSVHNNTFDGEPDLPIQKEFMIFLPERIIENPPKFQYDILYRLKCDCIYYLGYGKRNPCVLPSRNERAHIERMKRIWISFHGDKKPEWLTWKQILAYEKAMCTED